MPKYLLDQDGSVGERNDVALAGLNHKMGQRGITNTVLNFGKGKFTPGGKPGAVGYLVGEPHRGLACMFTMMNEARLGVGMGAVSLGYTEAFVHIVVAWIWLEQLVACNGRRGDFYDGKRQAAQYFFRTELPKTGPQLDLLAALDRTTLEMHDGWLVLAN